MIGVVFDSEFPAHGAQQEVMHNFVDAESGGGEPVVDTAQGCDDLAFDAGFLSNFAAGGLGCCFAGFQVALRQAPLEPAGSVDAGYDGDVAAAG